MIRKFIFSLVLTGIFSPIFAQTTLSGTVRTTAGVPIHTATVTVLGTTNGTLTDSLGNFSLQIALIDSLKLSFSHIAYESRQVLITSLDRLDIVLRDKNIVMDPVEVIGRTQEPTAGLIRIGTKALEESPGALNDFSSLLKTVPGVVSNNELSNSYSVRGGNYDENLVFVNDIPVYRPFLISNGRQEGLSMINPSFISGLNFSTGGWGAGYGGKLSSVLNIEYKRADKNGLSAMGSLLGGEMTVELQGDKWSLISGVRQKSTRYLFNTFDTKGEYLPSFTDFQTSIVYDISPKTSVDLLFGYARNRYYVRPSNRETEFGTFNRSFRLFVAFDGAESMDYDTWQAGFRVQSVRSDQWKLKLIGSVVSTNENEYTDLEGGYRLCDIDRIKDSTNDCLITRGIGTNYTYGRNELDARIGDFKLVSEHRIDLNNQLEAGIEYNITVISDKLNEYSFLDSADYVVDLQAIQSQNSLNYSMFSTYLQNTYRWSRGALSYGLRFTAPGQTGEALLSPRMNLSWRSRNRETLTYKLAAGIYNQAPMYREFRNSEGSLNENIKSQRAFHLVAGMENQKIFWGRPFVFNAEMYYKYLWNVIAYDIQNIRIRYFGDNTTVAQIAGADFRLSGEFIPGTESWFSLGILSAREDVEGDTKGYIRRPSDQRLTASILFQDYFPNNPSMRVALNFQFGSGLPFGPPGDIMNRNVFTGNIYRRVDIGFTKEFEVKFGQLFLTIEILNMLGADNVITYTWINDLANQQIAVPNSLSNRFFNFKIRAKI